MYLSTVLEYIYLFTFHYCLKDKIPLILKYKKVNCLETLLQDGHYLVPSQVFGSLSLSGGDVKSLRCDWLIHLKGRAPRFSAAADWPVHLSITPGLFLVSQSG